MEEKAAVTFYDFAPSRASIGSGAEEYMWGDIQLRVRTIGQPEAQHTVPVKLGVGAQFRPESFEVAPPALPGGDLDYHEFRAAAIDWCRQAIGPNGLLQMDDDPQGQVVLDNVLFLPQPMLRMITFRKRRKSQPW